MPGRSKQRLRLLSVQDRNRRQDTESISTQEDNLLCSGTLALRTLDVLDVVDRIRNTGVLRNALISEVYIALSVNGNVLKQSVTCDSAVDVRLSFLIEVDDLSIAATLEVEDTLVVPSVLIITDQLTLRISRQRGLTCTRETEEDSSVLTVHICVSRAVHRSDATKREEVVLHREHTLLHLTTVPCVDDHLFLSGNVEHDASLRVQAELFPVLHLSLRCVVNDEVRLLLEVSLSLRTDEHVGHEVSLPSNLDDEADLHTSVAVCAAVTINNIQLLVRQLFLSNLLHCVPSLLRSTVVIVVILLRIPPYGVVRSSIVNDELILRRTTCVDTGHAVHCT